MKKTLILHVAVPDFNADDLDQYAGYISEPQPPGPKDKLYVVTEEWMREEVGLTLVGRPGDKCMNDDFSVAAFTGIIVGAHTVDRDNKRAALKDWKESITEEEMSLLTPL